MSSSGRTDGGLTVAPLNTSGTRVADLYECLRADLARGGPPELVELPMLLDLDAGPRRKPKVRRNSSSCSSDG